jgi:hypothetical protein
MLQLEAVTSINGHRVKELRFLPRGRKRQRAQRLA